MTHWLDQWGSSKRCIKLWCLNLRVEGAAECGVTEYVRDISSVEVSLERGKLRDVRDTLRWFYGGLRALFRSVFRIKGFTSW